MRRPSETKLKATSYSLPIWVRMLPGDQMDNSCISMYVYQLFFEGAPVFHGVPPLQWLVIWPGVTSPGHCRPTKDAGFGDCSSLTQKLGNSRVPLGNAPQQSWKRSKCFWMLKGAQVESRMDQVQFHKDGDQ